MAKSWPINRVRDIPWRRAASAYFWIVLKALADSQSDTAIVTANVKGMKI